MHAAAAFVRTHSPIEVGCDAARHHELHSLILIAARASTIIGLSPIQAGHHFLQSKHKRLREPFNLLPEDGNVCRVQTRKPIHFTAMINCRSRSSSKQLVRARITTVLNFAVSRLLEDREWVERDHCRKRGELRPESSLKVVGGQRG